jgi:chemotaxis signal transduction protein
VSIDAAEIQPMPGTAQGSVANFLTGLVTHGGAMMALIDIPSLLSEQDGHAIAETTASRAMGG